MSFRPSPAEKPTTFAAFEAYADTAPSVRIYTEFGHASCGEAWIAGAEEASKHGFDYLHLTADDLEPHDGWLEVGIETVDDGKIPAPLVYHPNGVLESAGLLGLGCYTGPHEDGMSIEGTTVPFVSREMWEAVGMIPVHYCTDLWVSYRARQRGWDTVIRTGMRFTHYTAEAGRNYGRVSDDTRQYLELRDR